MKNIKNTIIKTLMGVLGLALLAWAGVIVYAWLDGEFSNFARSVGNICEELGEMVGDSAGYWLLGIPIFLGLRKIYKYFRKSNNVVSKEDEA